MVKLADLPRSVDIELVDSLKCYHYPYKAAIRSKLSLIHIFPFRRVTSGQKRYLQSVHIVSYGL